ncbi:MAG: hypothetical protein P8Z38_01280 [Robiginitalea sp.]
MKRGQLFMLLLVSASLIVSCSKEDIDSPELMFSNAKSDNGLDNGNGVHSGAFYNLDIIGLEEGKTADMTGDNGLLFVGFEGLTEINLMSGDDFRVMDANGTDGSAEFMLPNPDPDGDGITAYSIWVRQLGSVENATSAFCAGTDQSQEATTDREGFYQVCTSAPLSVESSSLSNPLIEDISIELLTISVETDLYIIDAVGNEVTIPAGRHAIFDEIFEDYLWYYNSNGLRVLQLRFYEMSSENN